MTIDIPEDIALRLKALAKQNDADINRPAADMLARYEAEPARPATKNGRRADRRVTLPETPNAVGLASPDTGGYFPRSREILNTEFADYLQRRAIAQMTFIIDSNFGFWWRSTTPMIVRHQTRL